MPLSSSIVTRLQYQHLTIRELAGDLPEAALRQPVHPGKWSAFENIAHLAAYQPVLEAGGDSLLGKTGLHPRYGLLTGREWTEFFLLHEAHHLFTLFMLVQDLRKNLQ